MGHVINERKARKSGCSCWELESGKLMCYSQGVVGTLHEDQIPLFCTNEDIENPENASKDLEGEQKRFAETVRRAESRYVRVPKEDKGIHRWGELLKDEFEKSYGKDGKKKKRAPKDTKVVEVEKTEIKGVEKAEVEEDYDFDAYTGDEYNYWELYGLVKYGIEQSGVPFVPKDGKRGTKEEFYQYIDDHITYIFPEIELEEDVSEEPKKAEITYEDLDRESKKDLLTYAKEDDIPVYSKMSKRELVNVIAEHMGLEIPIENLDDEDLLAKAKLHGYKGRSRNREILIEHIQTSQMGILPEKEEVTPVSVGEKEHYSLVEIDAVGMKDWMKNIRMASATWTGLNNLADVVPDDTSLLYKVRDKIEKAEVNKDMTEKGKRRLLRKVDARIRDIEKKARTTEDVDIVEQAEAKIRKITDKPRRELKSKDATYAEMMDTVSKFKGTDAELWSIKRYAERLEPHEIRAKDKRHILALIQAEVDRRIMRDADKYKRDTIKRDVKEAEVTIKGKDIKEVALKKKGTMKYSKAVKEAKEKAEEDYEKELHRIMQIKFIESGGAVVELSQDTKEDLNEYRKDRQEYHLEQLGKQYILMKEEPRKSDTDRLFNTYLDRIERAVGSKEALDEVEVSLHRYYLEGEAKDKLMDYLVKARKGQIVDEDEVIEEEIIEETPKETLKPKDAKKVRRKIKAAKDEGELIKLGKELLDYQIDNTVQSLVTEIEKKKDALQAPSVDDDEGVAEPRTTEAIADSKARWDAGKVSDKVKVLAYLFEKEGVSKDGIVRWANMPWDELPKHVKKNVEGYREKAAPIKDFDKKMAEMKEKIKEIAPDKEPVEKKEPIYKKVDATKLTYTEMEDRLRELDDVQVRLRALTPPEAIKEKNFIQQRMRKLDDDRYNYYKGMVVQLREKTLEGWTEDDLKAELDEDPNVSPKTRETVEIWLYGGKKEEE